jgi:hypothetical protein
MLKNFVWNWIHSENVDLVVAKALVLVDKNADIDDFLSNGKHL